MVPGLTSYDELMDAGFQVISVTILLTGLVKNSPREVLEERKLA